METTWTEIITQPVAFRPPRDRFARALGWFSIGLGLSEVAATRAVADLIGAPQHARSRFILRAVGVRELAAGLGILSRPRPAGWLWSRVLGDFMDLALLGVAARSNRSRRRR